MPCDYPVSCCSITGYSGGGKEMIALYSGENRPQSLSSPGQYALSGEHKHLKEMLYVSSLTRKPLFIPVVADFYSGLMVSIPIYTNSLKKKMSVDELRQFFTDYYKDEKIISVTGSDENAADNGFLYAAKFSGKDNMEITVAGNDERALIVSRFCNLGKGASGAAVQCMNIMLGVDETKGLAL
jgi:N-acetyl-gamma-glutamyl-phosphate reductase